MVIDGSTRSRILRIRRIFADWLIVVPTYFSPLTKVFWKGELEGKNLFFKKGFPLLIKLEKTSTIGSQLAGDRKFFQVWRQRTTASRAKQSVSGKTKKARVPLTLCSRFPKCYAKSAPHSSLLTPNSLTQIEQTTTAKNQTRPR